MNPAESFSNPEAFQTPSDHPETEIELMEIDQILHQNNVELLKQQLAAAHQLLNYQQNVVHALTEKLNLKEICLSQAENQAIELKHQYAIQQIELSEAQSVCADLRQLLKRQQRRQISENVIPTSKNGHVFNVQTRNVTRKNSISFGYESEGNSGQAAKPLTKAPPVRAWSAQERKLNEEAICCQRLTTLMLSSTTEVTTVSTHSVIDVSAQVVTHNAIASQRRPIELPRFALS